MLYVLVVLILTLASAASATTRYVGGSGCNDSNNGTSPGSAKCSLSAGVASMSSGDTLYLRQGSYGDLDYTQGICVPSGGNDYGAATIIASYPGETATLRSLNLWPCGGNSEFKYVIFDRLLIDGQHVIQDTISLGQSTHHIKFQNGEVINSWSLGFSFFGVGESQHIEVLNNKIHHHQQRGPNDGGGFAFYIQSSDNIIDGNEMYNLDGYAVQFYNGYQFSNVDRNIVRNNTIYNTGFVRFFGGITVNHGTDNQIYNNLIYNTFGALDVVRGSNNTLVANNTFYNNQGWGIRLDIGTSNGPNTTVKNNILLNSETIEVGGAPGTNCSHNISPGSPAGCMNNITSNPQFVNADGGDFKLQSGSPARNSGTTVAQVTTDIDGVSRPQPANGTYDRGAYEYVEGVVIPPTGDIYVDINGVGGNGCNDNNNGTITQPKCSLAAGVAALTSGKVLILRQGSYGDLDYGSICVPSGNNYSTATRIESYTGETATLSKLNLWPCGGNSEFKFVIFNRIVVDGQNTGTDPISMGQSTHHIRFQNGEVKNAIGIAFGLVGVGENQFIEVLNTKIHDIALRPPPATNSDGYGFYIQGSDTLIEGCEFYNLATYGVQLYNGYTFDSVDRNIIRNNIFHNTGFGGQFFGGITVNHGTDNHIYNNIFYNNYGVIDVVRNARNTIVANNTLYNNQAWGIRLDIGTSNGPNTTVKNNIIVTTPNIEVGGAPGVSCSNNLVPSAPSGCSSNITGNPQFTNPGANDFTLQSGSPAINSGTAIALVSKDFLGVNRPQPAFGNYDIGAYEFTGGIIPPDPTGDPTGAPVYVKKTGDDSRSCLTGESSATPLLTIAKALTCMATFPGKRMIISPGTYVELIDTVTQPIKGGTGPNYSNATTIEGDGTGDVIIQLPASGNAPVLFLRNGVNDKFIVFKKLIFDAANRVGSNGLGLYPEIDHIRFENVEIKNTHNGYETIFHWNATNIEFVDALIHDSAFDAIAFAENVDGFLCQRCHIYNSSAMGINATSAGTKSNFLIRETYVWGNTGTGIDIGTSTGASILNSIIHTNGGIGVRIRTGAQGTKTYNLTVYGNTGNGVQCDSGATGVEIKNTISYLNATLQDIVNNCGAITAANFTDDPLFVSPPSNWTLADGSGCINQGETLPSVTIDFAGNPRPDTPGGQYDIGAYERGQIVTEPPGPNVTVQPHNLRQVGMLF